MAKRKDSIVSVVLTGQPGKTLVQNVWRELVASEQQTDAEAARKRIDNVLEDAAKLMSEIDLERG